MNYIRDAIVRDICETEPADPNSQYSVCISLQSLELILDRHLCAVPLSLPQAFDDNNGLRRNETLHEEVARLTIELSRRDDVYSIVLNSVCAALERAGFDSVDDPGEAIDIMRERYLSTVPPDTVLPANAAYLPEKPEKRHIDAIFSAWDHYGPGSDKRVLGTPEAQRIYAALVEESKKGQKGQKGQ